MLEIKIPGYKTLQLEHLVMDYNGTMACDGKPLPGLQEILEVLSGSLQIHVITADTFGRVSAETVSMPVSLAILPPDDQAQGKLDYIKKLGVEHTIAIGNGNNDRLMLKEAGFGIALIQEEGASVATITAADVVCTNIVSALELLTNTKRLAATLRT